MGGRTAAAIWRTWSTSSTWQTGVRAGDGRLHPVRWLFRAVAMRLREHAQAPKLVEPQEASVHAVLDAFGDRDLRAWDRGHGQYGRRSGSDQSVEGQHLE